MIVKDFNGKSHKINLALYLKERTNCSSLHKTARNLLHRLFICKSILEEVPLPGTRMFADFFIPSESLMIEVQGEQHYNYNNFHYTNKMDFIKAKNRDKKKSEWATLNGLILITFPYNEDINEWTRRITSRND
jgi:very-short-patch-repair endonuclease